MKTNKAATSGRKPHKPGRRPLLHSLYELAIDFAILGRDTEQGFIYLRKAAENGDPEAQHKLGSWYEYGEGVQWNLTEAFNWFMRAAESGFSLAYWSIGRTYAEGKGVQRNGKKALGWFMRLADPRTIPQRIQSICLGLNGV